MPANSLLLKQIVSSWPLACVTDTPLFTAGLHSLSGLAGGSRFESLAVQRHVKNVPHVGTAREK